MLNTQAPTALRRASKFDEIRWNKCWKWNWCKINLCECVRKGAKDGGNEMRALKNSTWKNKEEEKYIYIQKKLEKSVKKKAFKYKGEKEQNEIE